MLSTILLILTCGIVQSQDPIQTSKGHKIRGISDPVGGYTKYLGIPYGIVDEKRPFSPSKPHPGINKDFDAKVSKPCLRIENVVISGVIDCLTLDIYVPNNPKILDLLPIMVWIKSESDFQHKTKIMKPDFLMSHSVIVIEVHYRLGIHGFMCLDTPEVPGNQGLKDQVLAFKWIRKNIRLFGGNVFEVTAFGGLSVNLHLFSSHEKLFHRAIIHSTSALVPMWLRKSNYSQAIAECIKKAGYNTKDIHGFLKRSLME
ncbi:hypothetical protein PYW08_007833 [Mythimna loreyi]|uniref:Uncharacterized protein n=1 Tax=Mythimna loreyi TaxID=667449 RepID=A0ACC2QCW0_9NEOP|nr:hypothetical protein PYW08_007833 [Mythimna loreyi]